MLLDPQRLLLFGHIEQPHCLIVAAAHHLCAVDKEARDVDGSGVTTACPHHRLGADVVDTHQSFGAARHEQLAVAAERGRVRGVLEVGQGLHDLIRLGAEDFDLWEK